jgi:hypothetical protein
MVLAGSALLPWTLVVVRVSFHRRSRGRLGVLLAVPWAGNLTGPQQLRDQEERGKDAGGATIGHEGV